MVKITDIMVGNWLINGIGEYFQANTQTIANYKLGYLTLGEMKVIPITEDMLLVNNFGPYRDEFYFPVEPKNKYKRRLSLCVEEWTEQGIASSFQVCYDHDATGLIIQYIHELQQVFKLYTKQELNLKL